MPQNYCLLRDVGGGGGESQFLTDKLTLFQPGGQIMPTTLLPAPTPPQIFGRCGVSAPIKMTLHATNYIDSSD